MKLQKKKCIKKCCRLLAISCSSNFSGVFVAQLCLILGDPMDYRPPGSCVLGISQARILEWVHSILQRIFPTWGSNPGLLHCGQILCHLNHQGSTEKTCWWSFNIHKACRTVSKTHLPSRNVRGMVIDKKFNTQQKFKKPISGDTFHSHPFKKSHEKMSASLNIREMQTKTIPWYHHTLVRWPLAKTLQRINVGDGVDKKEPSSTDAGNVNWEQTLWRTEWSFLKQWKGQWN